MKYDTFYNNARQNTILIVRLFIKFNTFYHWRQCMTIYNVNSQILKFCPRFLLNQRWKSLSLCPPASFLDVSVWSSTGNTVRRCQCRRVDLRRTVVALRSVDDQDIVETAVICFRCVSQQIEKFGGSHAGKVKRHPVTSSAVARVRIDDERTRPDAHVGR